MPSPSRPACRPSGKAAHNPPEPAADPYEIADAVAGLAAALCMRLRQEAERAADPADRSACQNAAGEAERIGGSWLRGIR